MIYESDHPIFRSHKHHAIHSDLTLVYPIGAGGQFLLSQLSGICSHDTAVNEYMADGITWLKMEEFLRGLDASGNADISTDDLPRLSDDWINSVLNNAASFRLTTAHQLPWMTARLFDFSCDQIIRINTDASYHWYVACMIWYKSKCSTNMEPYKIAQLLNHAQLTTPGMLRPTPYQICMRNLTSAGSNLRIYNTAFGWMYYMDCISRACDPSDMSNLSAYVAADMLQQIDIVGTMPLLAHDKMILGDLESHRTTMIECDYLELFMDLLIPKGSALERISLLDIAEYSRRNLGIARQVSTVLPDEMAGNWQRQIAEYQVRLDAACDRHGI